MEFAQRLISTRAGTIAVAAGAALLAGISIAVYLNRYRHSVSSAGAPVTVLVAKRAIAKGTSGSVVASQNMFTTATLRESQLREGAFSDPAAIRDRVAVRDVYKGQQLTATDFVAGAVSLPSTLTGTQRIVTIPLDSAHGLISSLQPGDRVDVFAGFNISPVCGCSGGAGTGTQSFPVIRRVMQNILVVGVAGQAKGAIGQQGSTNVSLRVSDAQAAKVAFASDNGKVWLALRPAANAHSTKDGLVTAETDLFGLPPLPVPKKVVNQYLKLYGRGSR
jgi:Flp pilus assembly protein CpaB